MYSRFWVFFLFITEETKAGAGPSEVHTYWESQLLFNMALFSIEMEHTSRYYLFIEALRIFARRQNKHQFVGVGSASKFCVCRGMEIRGAFPDDMS